MGYCENGETFRSVTHLGGDLSRTVVPHDDLGDHILQSGVAQVGSDQDDISKPAPIEDNCRHPTLFITAPGSSDRVESPVLDAGVECSVGGQR